MREVLTLQLGGLANFTATHFWNAQESYFTYSPDEFPFVCNDIHWRAGLGADGSETFLPRTLVYDLKGGFGSLRKINSLYDETQNPDLDSQSLWPGPVNLYKETALQPSLYQQSLNAGTQPGKLKSSSVRYWSDFSHVYYHPKSLIQLYDYELHSSIMPFEDFSMGNELFNALDKEHDIVDRDWRPFVEECDNMEGIQVFTSLDDAWGGFGASYVEALREEYPKAIIWVWGLQKPVGKNTHGKSQLTMTNIGQSVAQLSFQATTVVPLSLPEETDATLGVSLNPLSDWHTSALFATAAESATLPSRLYETSKSKLTSLTELAESLNTTGSRPISAMKLLIGETSVDVLRPQSWINLSNITHSRKKSTRLSEIEQNFGEVRCTRSQRHLEDREKSHAYGTDRSVWFGCTTNLEFPLLDSFPDIFTNNDFRTTVPVATSMTTDKCMSTQMKDLSSKVGWRYTSDEREELRNSLATLGDAYLAEWTSGSDSGDDDL